MESGRRKKTKERSLKRRSIQAGVDVSAIADMMRGKHNTHERPMSASGPVTAAPRPVKQRASTKKVKTASDVHGTEETEEDTVVRNPLYRSCTSPSLEASEGESECVDREASSLGGNTAGGESGSDSVSRTNAIL